MFHIQAVLDFAVDVITICGVLGVALGWYMTRQKRSARGNLAMDQISTMVNNHFPHMEASLKALESKTDDTNKHLEKLVDLQLEGNKVLAVLVDRGSRSV